MAYVDLNTRNGQRVSTAVASLRPALARPNMTLITNARVHRVEIADGRPTCISNMQDNEMHTVGAAREVLVCGGAIESPRILTLSGIGVLHGHLFAKSDPSLPGIDMRPLFFHVHYSAPKQHAPTGIVFALLALGAQPTSRGAITLENDDPDADYAQSAVLSYHHQCGTCKLGVDKMAVVDPELPVHGVHGLRVVDASHLLLCDGRQHQCTGEHGYREGRRHDPGCASALT